MNINPPSRFWSAVGKIALIITVIGGAVGLWHTFAPSREQPVSSTSSPGPNLIGNIDYFGFDLPPNIRTQIDKFRDLSNRDSAKTFVGANEDPIFDKFVSTLSPTLSELLSQSADGKLKTFVRFDDVLKKDQDRKNRLKERLETALSQVLTDYARSGLTRENEYTTSSYDSYAVVEVKNDGERQAQGVELQLPHKGISVVEEPGEKPSIQAFDHKIGLGTILPKGERKIQIWTTNRITSYSFDIDKWRLAYGEGVGKMVWAKKQDLFKD